MRQIICFNLLALLSQILCAQSLTLSPEVVASAGDRFASNTIGLEWTLGELMTESLTGSIILTQGFHQPALQTTSIGDPHASLGHITVYPNPTSGFLSIEREKAIPLALLVWDVHGRIVLRKDLSETVSQLDVSHLPAGIYVLRMSAGEKATHRVRIQKF